MTNNTIGQHSKFFAVIFFVLITLIGQSWVLAQTSTASVEIVGMVTAITPQSITVGSQTFDISTAETKTGVTVGKLVKVHATQTPSGQWVAREIESAQLTASQTPILNTTETPTPINELEIIGEITSLSDTSIVVAGHTIDISAAEIKNSLAVNDRVKLHVIVLNGQWIAREVESATVTVAANCTPVHPAGWITYTIQSGDTLSSIAFGSNSNLQALATANCIANPRNIQVGQTIFVAQQPVVVLGNHSGHGQDDGANHDLNDDHGNHNGSDDQQQDDNHNGGDDSESSGHSGSGSGEGSGHG